MKVAFTGRNLDVTPAIKEFAQERLDKLDRVIEGIAEAHVILVKEKYRHVAEIIVKGKHLVLTGTQETEDMYSSIGKALEKIEHQARKHRDMQVDKRRRGSRKASGGNGSAAPDEIVEQEVVANLPGDRLMLRDDDFPHKPMTAEEAALLLQDQERDFLVFREAATQRVGVVYRRDDGHLGLILSEA